MSTLNNKIAKMNAKNNVDDLSLDEKILLLKFRIHDLECQKDLIVSSKELAYHCRIIDSKQSKLQSLLVEKQLCDAEQKYEKLHKQYVVLCDFISRELKMDANDPRIQELQTLMQNEAS
jgi:hypothetical protein